LAALSALLKITGEGSETAASRLPDHNVLPLNLTIRTDRLTLREIRPEDADWVYRVENLPEVLRHELFDVKSAEEAREAVNAVIRAAAEIPRIHYELAICLADSDQMFGKVGALVTPRATSLWYMVEPTHQGKGYATEGSGALLRHLESQRRRTFVIECDARNRASYRVAEKLGFELVPNTNRELLIRGETVESRLYRKLPSSLSWWQAVRLCLSGKA
jgi:RimJ/RimL family protein N-acetyltransferase